LNEQAQLSTDGRTAQPESQRDVRWAMNPAGDERHDLTPGCISEELDALRRTPWHGLNPSWRAGS
jgi:hypothetical protein